MYVRFHFIELHNTSQPIVMLQMLDDFVDVTKDEKQLMHLWNSFVRKQRYFLLSHLNFFHLRHFLYSFSVCSHLFCQSVISLLLFLKYLVPHLTCLSYLCICLFLKVMIFILNPDLIVWTLRRVGHLTCY